VCRFLFFGLLHSIDRSIEEAMSAIHIDDFFFISSCRIVRVDLIYLYIYLYIHTHTFVCMHIYMC